ncbi:MAG: hypothetical protein LBK58_09850 [Prevotellaceae bacterium]|jgi:hypothetical protein|nr:hypothetical protein [Prevotellaceae bacterium]
MTNRINPDEINESLIIASVRKNRTAVPENSPVETAPENSSDKIVSSPEVETVSVSTEPPKEEDWFIRENYTPEIQKELLIQIFL